MSDSPVRRFSTASPVNHLKREESLINAYEAEEERIINVLSRKLEQVCLFVGFLLFRLSAFCYPARRLFFFCLPPFFCDKARF